MSVKTGEISSIDATVIDAKQSRRHNNAQGANTQDAEAGYNVKVAANGNKTRTYGFKAHVTPTNTSTPTKTVSSRPLITAPAMNTTRIA